MHPALQIAVVLGAIFASSGFWAFLQYRDSSNKASTQLMMGLAYDKIVQLGVAHINRGWISKDELEEFIKNLWEPYKALGGNGVASRIMSEVAMLPIRYHQTRSHTSIQATEKGFSSAE